jgi:hypothetical protein
MAYRFCEQGHGRFHVPPGQVLAWSCPECIGRTPLAVSDEQDDARTSPRRGGRPDLWARWRPFDPTIYRPPEDSDLAERIGSTQYPQESPLSPRMPWSGT